MSPGKYIVESDRWGWIVSVDIANLELYVCVFQWFRKGTSRTYMLYDSLKSLHGLVSNVHCQSSSVHVYTGGRDLMPTES